MRFVITAGPTREYLDPVRFLSNPSTGKMGFAVARVAAQRGHEVTLIAGPVALRTPRGVRRVDVVSAREMLEESLRSLRSVSCVSGGEVEPVVFVSTAAIADWRPAECAAQKLKKTQMSGTLKLVRNPDILRTIHETITSQTSSQPQPPTSTSSHTSQPQPPTSTSSHTSQTSLSSPTFLVGFAAETNDMLAEASRKCREKGLSFIVANDVTQPGAGFGTDTNRVTFVFPGGHQKALPLMSKLSVARRIVRECENLGL